MTQTVIDLTGRGGLAAGFQGDLNDSAPTPHLRYQAGDSQTVGGIYNPLRIDGYIAPANNVFTSLTGTITNKIISRAYSSSNNKLYLAEDGPNLGVLDGLSDTSVTETSTLSGTSTFKDLEMYEMNGEEALFYTYREYDSSVSTTANMQVGWKTIDSDKGALLIASKVLGNLTGANASSEAMPGAITQKMAQSFKAYDSAIKTSSTVTVTGIRVAIRVPYTTTQTWTLQGGIQTDSSGSPSGSYVTNGSVTIDANTLPKGNFTYVYLTFSTPVSLTTASTYHIVLEATVYAEMGSNEGLEWMRGNASVSTYSNGYAERYNGSTWSQFDTTVSQSFDFALILNTSNYFGRTLPSAGGVRPGEPFTKYIVASSTTQTFNVSSTDNNVTVIAIKTTAATNTLTAATVDGVALTQIAIDSGASLRVYLYYIKNLAVGSHTLSVTFSGSETITINGSVYYGVDQSNVYTTAGSGTASLATSATTSSLTVPSTGGMPVVTVNGSGVTISASTNSTLRKQNSSDLANGLFDTNTNQTSNIALTFTASGATAWQYTYVVLNAAVVSGLPLVNAITESIATSTFLKKADNGFLYWFTNNRVHEIDGGTTGGNVGTFTADVLNFPSYLTITDACDTNGITYIAVQSSEIGTSTETRTFNADTIGVYLWDRLSTVSGTRNFIPAYGAREIRRIFTNGDGEIRAITIGEDGFTEIRYITGNKLQVLKRLPRLAYPTVRDGVDVLNNLVIWFGTDGVIYGLGKLPESGTEGLYRLGSMADQIEAGTLESGIICTGNDDSVLKEGVYLSWYINVTPTSTTLFPSTTSVDTTVGTLTWSNTSNVVSSNNSYATAVASDASQTHYIKTTNYGFAVPSTYTILGVTGYIEKKDTAGAAADYIIKLVKGGTITGNNKADTVTAYGTSDATATYGSTTDLWGTTLTASDVNSSTFGLVYSASTNLIGANTVSVDAISLKVTYSPVTIHLRKWFPHGTGTINSVSQTGNIGNVYFPVKQLTKLSTLKNIDIMCIPAGVDGSTTAVATVKYYANQSTTPFATKVVTQDEISRGYVSHELNKPYVNALQIEVEWATVELGSNDFTPTYAVLSYDGTATIR